jgi:hypothetical protein
MNIGPARGSQTTLNGIPEERSGIARRHRQSTGRVHFNFQTRIVLLLPETRNWESGLTAMH